MTPSIIRSALDELGVRDNELAKAVKLVGYPEPRVREPGFATLLGIIVGQQVSASAAAAIRGRLLEAVAPLTPENYLSTSDEILRGVGLSRRKVEYGRSLADAVQSGNLDTERLAALDDQSVIEAITAVRGLGRWSADIYMLFALGRHDVWPAEDLAVAEALKRLKGLEERPDRAASEAVIEHWRPWRGVGALFLWHYYQGAP